MGFSGSWDRTPLGQRFHLLRRHPPRKRTLLTSLQGQRCRWPAQSQNRSRLGVLMALRTKAKQHTYPICRGLPPGQPLCLSQGSMGRCDTSTTLHNRRCLFLLPGSLVRLKCRGVQTHSKHPPCERHTCIRACSQEHELRVRPGAPLLKLGVSCQRVTACKLS